MNPSQRHRQPRRALHGVLLLDKPLGLSSNDALQKVKRIYRAEKAGVSSISNVNTFPRAR